MSMFKLSYDGEIVIIHDTDAMDPGELDAMKYLSRFGKWKLERTPKDALPLADHDVLDDIALSILNGRKYSAPVGDVIVEQARKRAAERGLQ